MIINLIALLLITGAGFFIKMKYEQSKMKPLDTQEVIPGIFVVRNDFVNFFLLKNGEKYIAIDTGEDISKTKEELNRLGILSDDVIAIFLTHNHSDHIGALSIFDKAIVYARKKIKSQNANVLNKTLADNETVEISNFQIQCIFAPGHTSDSVCYLIDGKYLFVGDTLSLQDNKVGLFNSFYNKSDDIQKADIKKLAELNSMEYIFSAHYGITDKAIFP